LSLVGVIDDYQARLTQRNIDIGTFNAFIGENIRVVQEKYRTMEDIDNANFDLLKLTDKKHEERLIERQKLYRKIIADPVSLAKFAQFFDVSDTKKETKLFTQPQSSDSRNKIEAILGSFTFENSIKLVGAIS
jgi:hypothetical protein